MTKANFPVDVKVNSSTETEDELMAEGGCGSGLVKHTC